ncbi:ribbon-helix-helix protein, CopG family [Domibacillus indicus]|uniref:ribbon-helix-helix protein, CopG family n=1 Tax=Domibacillus indicus TaxID=1437523 RepID=UPI0006183114|nr:ribbon-helix-helix protein, CopG family [Domibacillus indicus]
MSYLEKFARNKRRKEPSTVLTARLPESLYEQFKEHCDELGLSISEAIYLLVQREITENMKFTEGSPEYNDEYMKNNHAVVKNTDPIIKHTGRGTVNTKRFTVKQWEVEGELPCPICGSWVGSSNFARHARQHNATTKEIFTNEEYLQEVRDMMQQKKSLVAEGV